MAEPTSKAQVSPTFARNLEKLAEAGTNIYDAVTAGKQRRWIDLHSEGHDFDPIYDPNGLSETFSRKEVAKDVYAATADGESPGVVGDLIAVALQGDYLACQERAYRMRTLAWQRAVYHAAARRGGHGHPAGLFRRGVLGHITKILKASKVEPPEA